MTLTAALDLTDVKVPEGFASSIRELVLSYLVHSCHEETAKSFANAIYDGLPPQDENQGQGKQSFKMPEKPRTITSANDDIVDDDGDVDMSEATRTAACLSNSFGSSQQFKWLSIRKCKKPRFKEHYLNISHKKAYS
jgi:hypothetical protein